MDGILFHAFNGFLRFLSCMCYSSDKLLESTRGDRPNLLSSSSSKTSSSSRAAILFLTLSYTPALSTGTSFRFLPLVDWVPFTGVEADEGVVGVRGGGWEDVGGAGGADMGAGGAGPGGGGLAGLADALGEG